MAFQITISKNKTLLKASHKRSKAVLALKVRKSSLTFLGVNLGKFSHFDNFLDLTNFLPFNFLDFIANFLPLSLIPYLSDSLLPIFSYLEINFFSGIVVFNIKMNKAAILLRP